MLIDYIIWLCHFLQITCHLVCCFSAFHVSTEYDLHTMQCATIPPILHPSPH